MERGNNRKEVTMLTFKEIMQNAYIKYLDSKTYSVQNAYKKPSMDKRLIEMSVLEQKMYAVNGHDYRVIGNNIFTFSCGFVTDTEFWYITRTQTRHISFREMLS